MNGSFSAVHCSVSVHAVVIPDQPLTVEDRDRMLAYRSGLGALDEPRQYRGSPRRGIDTEGRGTTPVPLRALFGGIPSFYVETD